MGTDDKKIFVGGISWETTSEGLKQHFSQFGTVTDSVIMVDNVTKKPRGFGFVTFEDPKSVERALQYESPHMLDNKKIDPKPAVNQGAGKFPPTGTSGTGSQSEKVKKVFVGGIPTGTDEEEIRAFFGAYGIVTDVELKFDKATQRMRGFGFVTFESEDDVDRLVDQHFVDFKEKKVEVKKAEPRYLGGGGGGMGHTGGGGGGFGGSSKSYTPGGYQSGYSRSGGGGSGNQYGYGYGYGQATNYGQASYGQGGFGQGGYTGYGAGAYNQGFTQPNYAQGSYNQQGAFGYSPTQNYGYAHSYDTSGGRPSQQQVSGGTYQQESSMYSQGSVARGGFPSGTEQYSGGSYSTAYGGGSDMSSSGSGYQQYTQGNGEKQSGGFAGGPRGGQQTHPSAQYSAGFGGGR